MGFVSDGLDPFHTLEKAILGNLMIAIMGTVPGYWLTVLFVDKWGRMPI